MSYARKPDKPRQIVKEWQSDEFGFMTLEYPSDFRGMAALRLNKGLGRSDKISLFPAEILQLFESWGHEGGYALGYQDGQQDRPSPIPLSDPAEA